MHRTDPSRVVLHERGPLGVAIHYSGGAVVSLAVRIMMKIITMTCRIGGGVAACRMSFLKRGSARVLHAAATKDELAFDIR